MKLGAHLPLIDFDGSPFDPSMLRRYVDAAGDNGFSAITANDHLVFQRPWLDGIVTLASVVERSRDLTLATTVALPVIRGPAALAKAAAALQILSGDRFVLGVGPGSSAADYDLVMVPFEERWPRFDKAVRVLRSEPCPTRTRAVATGPRLDRELGLGCRTAAGRPPRGRLACVGVQHDTRAARRRPGQPAHCAAGGGP